jgi:hypothetical protein
MSTLSAIRSNIADSLNRSDLSTQIDRAINRAIVFYRSQRFYFNETSGTFVTVADQESYGTADGIPSTINNINRVELTVTSTYKPELIRRTFNYVRKLNGFVAKGQPYDYAWYQQKFYLSPIPNAVYTVTVYFNKNYAELTLDADTNDFLTEAKDLIEARSEWWIAKKILKDDELAAAAKEDEKEALLSLRIRTDRYLTSSTLQPTCF